MKLSRRVIKYAKENYNGVKHTTLNPEGPGVYMYDGHAVSLW